MTALITVCALQAAVNPAATTGASHANRQPIGTLLKDKLIMAELQAFKGLGRDALLG